MYCHEAYGCVFDSEEERKEYLQRAMEERRCSEATTHSISPLLDFTDYVVQTEADNEEELEAQFANALEWRLNKDCWRIIVGSSSLQPIHARLRFAQLNGRIVLFCSADKGISGAHVLNLWLRQYCNPETAEGERAYCRDTEFERCVRFLQK
jgi:hypothetical protein